MPNGSDKNWVRFCAAIDGYRSRYEQWPSKVRLYSDVIRDLRIILGKDGFSALESKLKLIPDDAPIIAEDEEGRKYSYGDEGFSYKDPDVSARDWLKIRPLPEYDD